MALGTAAAVFALDLTFDAVPFLPDLLTGLCLLFVLQGFKDASRLYRNAFRLGILYTALSTLSYILNLIYLRLFETYNAVNIIEEAYLLTASTVQSQSLRRHRLSSSSFLSSASFLRIFCKTSPRGLLPVPRSGHMQGFSAR
jgi:hypothetical protein